MTTFQPLNDHVLVKTEAAEKKTESGIIIPDTASSSREIGEVVAVAPGGGETVAVGDRVMFRKSSAIEIEDGGKDYLLVPYKDLLGKYAMAEAI
ncbi:MAG: co-chaperone GroES [Bacteroidota bacterium]